MMKNMIIVVVINLVALLSERISLLIHLKVTWLKP
jgi:hypothetical protein